MAPTTPKTRRKTSRKEYSPHTRGRIAMAYSKGTKLIDIAKELSIPKGSVYGILKRYKTQQKGRSQPRAGRTAILSERDKRHIQRAVFQSPFDSAKEIRDKCEIKAGESTISRAMRKSGLGHWKALRRPKLTPDHAKARLEFAKIHVHKPLDWWRRVIFSDETSIQRGCGDRTKWVWCRKVRVFIFTFFVYYY